MAVVGEIKCCMLARTGDVVKVVLPKDMKPEEQCFRVFTFVMDVLSTLDVVRKYGAEPVPRVFRDRTCPYDALSDVEFCKDFRFTRRVFYEICAMVQADLEPVGRQRTCMTVADKVAMAIHLLGRNVMQSDSARLAGCHQGTASRVLMAFVSAMNKRAAQFIRWPEPGECAELRRLFFRKYGLPGVVGITDGTHCRIQRPAVNEEEFVCRNGYHSLNVGMVVDYHKKIRWVCANWPGSARDSRVFRTSALYRQLKSRELEGVLLGDSAYAAETFLLKPVNTPRTDQEERYNGAVNSARARIEQSFVYSFRYSPEKAAEIIVTCCVLRNISIENNEPEDYTEYFGRTARMSGTSTTKSTYPPAGVIACSCRTSSRGSSYNSSHILYNNILKSQLNV
ncbi:unnamed protein product [Heligmosomoides polygyrus]|uniref:Putative nuclease HARBI1 n=1 Tax=Heligmosomoides polygyrus TaxID=6339 RepID=A0A183FKB2_HELPZ|nr:unnamed protein product [Heligmosomoides polygyrus]